MFFVISCGGIEIFTNELGVNHLINRTVIGLSS